MEIAIIGGGPAGNYAAYLLAKKGHSVKVYEKNPEIGPPVQCTGILSDYFKTILKPKKEFVLNTVNKTRIYAPNGRYVEARIKKNYVVCRKKFDRYLADLAIKEGAEYFLNHSFNYYVNESGKIIITLNSKGRKVIVKTDILIGADGPTSPVAKAAGLYKNRNFVIGTQVEAKKKNDNVVEFYPYIGCYAWIVPVDKKTVRIGSASYTNAMSVFKRFAEEKLGKNYPKKVIENQSGVIPLFNPKVRVQKDKIFLTGDAASFVKATSGGGINQSLKAAIILAESIDKGKNFDKAWRKKLYRNLHMHLIIHKILQKFTEKDWNNLISIFSRGSMKKILYSGSRDRLIQMLIPIAISQPRLFKYLRYFPKEEFQNLF